MTSERSESRAGRPLPPKQQGFFFSSSFSQPLCKDKSSQDDELGQTNVCKLLSANTGAYLTLWNRLANVAGTQEPIYGPSAIQSVAKQAETTPYTELKREDLKWAAMESTCVETQSFYLMSDSGHLGLAQVIYSNVAFAAPWEILPQKVY